MQAIATKFIPATNTRSNRLSAHAAAGRIVVEWDYGLPDEQNHVKAAQALCDKLEWPWAFVTGTLPDGTVVHVSLPDGFVPA